MPDTAHFIMKYSGPALDSHEMDVKDISPSLLAVGEILEEANRLLNGNRVKVAVNVKAFRDGSLGVDLNLVQNTLNIVDLFNNQYLVGALNLLQIVGFASGGTAGLLKVIKWLKNRKISNITRLSVGKVQIEVEDGDTLVTVEQVTKLLASVRVRKSFEDVVHKPLQNEGIEEVSFTVGGNSEEISKQDAASFISPELKEEPIDQQEYEISLKIVSAVFQEDNKWRFSDGTTSFWAEMLDEEFMNRVHASAEAFAKDDILRVKMLRKQYEILSGIKTDFFVVKVLNHKSALNTYPLPFIDKKNE